MEIERAYLDKGFYGEMHVTALRETDTEFLIKSRRVEPVKDVIDGLEEWNVDWGIMQDYEISDLKQRINICSERPCFLSLVLMQFSSPIRRCCYGLSWSPCT